MRLVELVAPPGAGKSTLAATLLRDRGASGWSDARDVVRPARVPGGAALAARGALRGLPRPWRSALLAAPDEDAIARALVDVAEDWAPFLALVSRPDPDAAGSEDPRRTVLSLLARRWFIEALGLRALLARASRERSGPGTALLDEGLLHPYKVDGGVGRDATRRDAYLAAVPLPDVVVATELPAATLIDRLANLARVRPDRLRLAVLPAGDPDALAAEVRRVQDDAARAVEAARRRGAMVVRVDGTRTLDEQVEHVLTALREGDGAS